MAVQLKIKDFLLSQDSEKRNEIIAILLFAVSIFILISLITFDYNDLPMFTSQVNRPLNNFDGIVGAYIGCVFWTVMGMSSYAIPLLIMFWAIARFSGSKPENYYIKFFGTLFLIIAASSTFSFLAGNELGLKFRMGGIVGVSFSGFLMKYLGTIGSAVAIVVILLLSILVATDFLIFPFLISVIKFVGTRLSKIASMILSIKIPKSKPKTVYRSSSKGNPRIKPAVTPSKGALKRRDGIQEEIKEESDGETLDDPAVHAPNEQVKHNSKDKDQDIQPEPRPDTIEPYSLPELSLLNRPPAFDNMEIKEDLTENSRILEEILSDFDIEAKVIEVNKGPVITRYELEPGAGVQIRRITALSDNIALGMKAVSVRIIAPVPGKGTVGVEVPNSKSAMVYLRDVLESEEYLENDSKLKLALGKDIAGEAVVADLAKMPHLLIAGATGSGKTVCVNSIITSLLFNTTPEELRFIMVDPKKVELAPFNGLPHLLCPVITDYKKVPIALDWLVQEMEKRFELFANCGVRNIDSYNEKAESEDWALMHYIVVIIDELADLMMVSQQEIETTITRLAQLSRAVGIHMILATQRPSVNVITGVIKANFPARISFKVASKVDSRTVLDRNGADKLLGRGDMLVLEPSSDRPIRSQGGLVSDKEIDRLTKYIRDQREPSYVEDITKSAKKSGSGGTQFARDEVYEEAVKMVTRTRQASVSMIQRKLGVGYNRAARLIDMMEDDGIVGPYQGSKPREVLIDDVEGAPETVENEN